MIISCPNCKKQFKINPGLIPAKGRDLKCGSCNYVWFYKIEDNKPEPLSLNEEIIFNKDKSIIFEKENKIEKKEDKNQEKNIDKKILNKNTKKENISSKFFSYLVVIIISFVSFIVLLDTLKAPLIKVFPGLEIILFNLFEIMQDIRLFIIDLY